MVQSVNIKTKTVVMNFKKFDPLNIKYNILMFEDVPVNSIIRYSGFWRRKIGPHYVVDRWNNTNNYLSVNHNKFVLLVDNIAAAQKIEKEFGIPAK